MEAAAAPVNLHRALPPEEAARGNFYALLARLFANAPDASLLGRLAAAEALPDAGNPDLARTWRRLVDASSAMDADAAADEYEKLFVGVGKARVSMYSGYYTGAPAIAHPRVRIQADLAALGLARKGGVAEPEDHFAGLFEVMRVLVAGGAGREPAPSPSRSASSRRTCCRRSRNSSRRLEPRPKPITIAPWPSSPGRSWPSRPNRSSSTKTSLRKGGP